MSATTGRQHIWNGMKALRAAHARSRGDRDTNRQVLAPPLEDSYDRRAQMPATNAAIPNSWLTTHLEDQRPVSASPPLSTDKAPRTLVTIATFNEAGNLKSLVETIREVAPEVSVLVIDDNSPDGTGRVADELVASLPDIHVIHRPGKLGLGTATMDAMRFAIENRYDYLLNLDADFSHPPSFIPDLLAGMRDHDVMIGSRYVPGGGVEGGFTLKRQFMSSGINSYARLFLGLRSRDNSGAYRCYRVSKLAQIDFSKIRSRGYSFQEEILFWCATVGCRIGETPILFMNRRAGVSKINKREAFDALRIICELGISRWIGRL